MARRAGIEREQLLAAATELADRDGLAALTLTELAARLGIRPPSLYAHVDGLDGLHRALRARGAHVVAGVLADAAAGRHGADAIRAFAYAYRQFASDHPGLYDATLRGSDPDDDPGLAAAGAEPVAVIVGTLASIGIEGDLTLHTVRVFRGTLHGFVDLERRGGFGLPLDLDETFEQLVETVLAPRTTGAATAAARPRPARH